jgi:hypothetical protein
MTHDRLRECLGALNWSTSALAAMAQVSPVTARRWQDRGLTQRVAEKATTVIHRWL